jgi:transposase-like protein
VVWQKFWQVQSMRERDSYMKTGWYDRVAGDEREGYRNGFYVRDFVTRLGTIRLRIARTRKRNFLPAGLEKFQRRAPEVAMLIREAFLRGISTRKVGPIVATLTGEAVSAQTVSTLIRDLDGAVQQFHSAPLQDDWA